MITNARKIRFLQIGDFDNALINNLCVILTGLQRSFEFDFDDNIIQIEPMLLGKTGILSEAYRDRLIKEYMLKNRYGEYPIALTNYPLENELFSSNYESHATISLANWGIYSRYPLEKGIPYIIAPILLDLKEDMSCHLKTKACPNDYCDDLADINLGLEKCDFCTACRQKIISAIGRGTISVSEFASVMRILDYVADRTICFVIMPFEEKFQRVFSAIKESFSIKHSDTCYQVLRADDIFRTADVMDIVFEMIERSDLLIADLTGRNPNVFYEVGYSHSLGRNTILIAQNREDIPFDLRNRQCVFYNFTELPSTLTNILIKYLET
jgi:hypothetical protein